MTLLMGAALLLNIQTNQSWADSTKPEMVNSPVKAMTIYNELKSQHEVKSIDEIIKNAPQSEKGDLVKLLNDIELAPINQPSEPNLYRVKKVASGSIYEKAGVKVGELVRFKK